MYIKEIENINLKKDNIKQYICADIIVNCPKCKLEIIKYNVKRNGVYMCRCDRCGYRFKFNYFIKESN